MTPLPPASYDEALARRVAGTGPVSLSGSSGYFAPRGSTLDPSLFDHSGRLYPEVRRMVLTTLYQFWGKLYAHPQHWSTVWLAGSGITTAWNADREAGGAPGDLDTLIGVQYQSFFELNPSYRGNSEVALASHFNQQLHDGLWPSTERTQIGVGLYELTYYVNPGGSDIRAINPYAAYNVTDDSWTVKPVEVPSDFSERSFSNADRELVWRDQQRALEVVSHYNMLVRDLRATSERAARLNLAVQLHNTVRTGAQIFDEIHEGRHAAFAPGGRGYFDPANYRWQAGKGNGTVPAMRQLKQLDQEAHRDIGTPCNDAAHLLLVAALANGR